MKVQSDIVPDTDGEAHVETKMRATILTGVLGHPKVGDRWGWWRGRVESPILKLFGQSSAISSTTMHVHVARKAFHFQDTHLATKTINQSTTITSTTHIDNTVTTTPGHIRIQELCIESGMHAAENEHLRGLQITITTRPADVISRRVCFRCGSSCGNSFFSLHYSEAATSKAPNPKYCELILLKSLSVDGQVCI